MKKPVFDPGLTQRFTGELTRAINDDGSFNVQRRGGSWKNIHPYLYLVNIHWASFLGIVFLCYLAVNLIFATLYLTLAPGELIGANSTDAVTRFTNAFFFSAHTLTTVGYGNIAPGGVLANVLAATEAMVGLMGFALATGLLFGRVSRPSARIGFSPKMLVAPLPGGMSYQFRIVNLRPNVLMEIEAKVMLMTVEGEPKLLRRYTALSLERQSIYFLPLSWTIVHPLEEDSPLFGKTPQQLEKLQAEFLVLIKGFDDTFSQTVHARYSYRYDQIAWNAHFTPTFEIDGSGNMVLNVDQVGKYEPI